MNDSQASPISLLKKANSLMVETKRSQDSPNNKWGSRSPTLEEQKSLNMAESLNARAMEADGQNREEYNWYELRAHGQIPQRRGYHSSFIYQNK